MDYDQAIRFDPELAVAFANRAIDFVILGDDPAARQDFDRAVELGIDPGPLERTIQGIKSQR